MRARRFSIEPLERRDLLSVTYSILNLGTLAGTDSSYATDVNNQGQVVGNAVREGLFPQTRAFQYDSAGGIQDLGTLGGSDASAVAINDQGQITGWAHNASGKQLGYRYDPGVGMFDIGGVGTNAGVYPADININGDVVGGTYYNGMGVGFIYTDANGIGINTPATNTASRSTRAINDNGVTAVYSSARSWIDGEAWIDGAYPTALNNSNVATGSSDPFGRGGELFRYTPGVGSQLLGQLAGGHTIGSDVNEQGVIVGSGNLPGGTSHGLIYTDVDGMVDLNDLVSPSDGWELLTAQGINDQGHIVGDGIVGGQHRAFLLTPFSGPDTEAPLATLQPATIADGNVAEITFAVAYWDRSGVSVASLDNADVTLTAPDGTTASASLVGADVATDGIRRVATYSVAAPAGVWGAKDNGLWHVAVNAGQVSDTNGDTVAAGEIGTFQVAIPHTVTAGITGPAIGKATVADTFTLTAATTWSFDAAETFQFAVDWNGDGVSDQQVSGPSGTTVDHAFAAAGDYTIRVVATDAQGAASSEATAAVTVTPAPGYQVWEFAPAFSGTHRTGAAGVNWNGTLYAIGGSPFANGGEEGAVQSLAPGAAAWQARQHLDSGMLGDVGVGVLSTGSVAVFGGTRQGQPVTSNFLYSPKDGKGDGLAPKTFAVMNFAFATDASGRVYSIGGADSAGALVTSVERYDASADAWTTLAPLPDARQDAAAAYDGAGHVLVLGGVDAAGVRQASVFSYDIANDTWTAVAPLPEAVSGGAAALGADGLVYYAGGQTAGGESDRLYVFNPAGGGWRTGPTMLTTHSDHAIALADDGFLYVMGGQATNVVEKIDTNASSQTPVAADDSVTTAEDLPATIDVLANDTDADGDPLTVASIDAAGLAGSVVVNPDGTLTYTPQADFYGVESFTYRVSDPGGQLDEATVTVTVASDGVTAGDDAAATDEDTPVAIPVADLLANDTSLNAGAVLSLTSVDAVSSQGATVTLAAGSVTYDPSGSALLQRLAAGDVVIDTFRYVLQDGTGQGESGRVAVTLTGVNDNPTANNDAAVVGYKLEVVDAPGATSTSIVGLNNVGVAVGTYTDAAGAHIFTYDGSTFTEIGDQMRALLAAQGISTSVSPHGINDAGTIVGGIAGTSNMVGFTGAEGFIYDGTSILAVQYSVRDSSLADVNNNGLAVGSYASPASYTTTSVGFTYDNGRVGAVTHPDHTYLRGTWLTDATDAGVLLGNYYPSFYTSSRGFVYDGQTWTDVLFPGTTWGYASGINNAGAIVGTQIHGNGADRYGFVLDAGRYESFQYPGWSGWTDLQDITAADVGTHSITIYGANSAGAADFTFTVDVHPAGTDLIRPTTIDTPTATTLAHNGGTIQWTPGTDNVGVVGQRIYGRLVGTTTSFVVADLPATASTYTITSFTPNTAYMLWVSAYDAAGNEGPHAGSVYPLFLTTLAAPNNPPVAVDDAYHATEDTPLSVNTPAANVLYHESFDGLADPSPLSAAGWSIVTGTANPTVVNADFMVNDNLNVNKITTTDDAGFAFGSGHLFLEHRGGPERAGDGDDHCGPCTAGQHEEVFCSRFYKQTHVLVCRPGDGAGRQSAGCRKPEADGHCHACRWHSDVGRRQTPQGLCLRRCGRIGWLVDARRSRQIGRHRYRRREHLDCRPR